MKTESASQPLLIGITSIALGGLLVGCAPKRPVAEVPEPKVNGDTVELASNSPQLSSLTIDRVGAEQQEVVPLTGRLGWDETATVRVFTPFAGIVRNLYVEVNQPITKGQPLAEIQSPDFGQAQAEARKAESDFRRAELTLSRVRDLFEHGAAPRKDWESAEADFAGAQAERDRTNARLAIYGATTTSTNAGFLLPSPLTGIVVEKNITPGQEVRPDQMLANAPQFTAPLFIITDPSRLWLQIDATELDLCSLKRGSEFIFNSRAFPNKNFTGRVEVISEALDPVTHTIKVRGTVDNTARLLKAEMFVTVTMPGGTVSATSVPAKAVFLKGDKHYVFVEQQTGQFVRQEISPGAEQSGRIEVLSGLQPGQRVVTDGCVLLQQTLQ